MAYPATLPQHVRQVDVLYKHRRSTCMRDRDLCGATILAYLTGENIQSGAPLRGAPLCVCSNGEICKNCCSIDLCRACMCCVYACTAHLLVAHADTCVVATRLLPAVLLHGRAHVCALLQAFCIKVFFAKRQDLKNGAGGSKTYTCHASFGIIQNMDYEPAEICRYMCSIDLCRACMCCVYACTAHFLVARACMNTFAASCPPAQF